MKYVGFIEEQDKNICTAKHFNEMFMSYENDIHVRSNIIIYLESGIFLTGIMSRIYDNEGQSIGNLDYFTDGEFIWPIYYPYYLKKYKNFTIDSELLEFAQMRNYKIKSIEKNDLIVIEKEFVNEWSGKNKKKL